MDKNENKLTLTLFLDYFKIGLFTFGGGLSMITLIEKTFVEKRKYITKDELLDIIAISESTPGPVAVNMATYIGYKVKGTIGSIFSTIGVILPSFIIILLISLFYEKFIEIKFIRYFISGIMMGVTYLIFRAGFKVFKTYKKGFFEYLLICLSFIAVLLIKIFNINFSTVFIVLIGGLLSLIYYSIILKKKKKEENKK